VSVWWASFGGGCLASLWCVRMGASKSKPSVGSFCVCVGKRKRVEGVQGLIISVSPVIFILCQPSQTSQPSRLKR
jgi:hypothetical protein